MTSRSVLECGSLPCRSDLAKAGPLRLTPFSILKGLCPPAQGCEERATLGNSPNEGDNPERVVALLCCVPSGKGVATTLSGLNPRRHCIPRVARSSQPWALGRNPIGILPDMPGSKDACKVQRGLAHS